MLYIETFSTYPLILFRQIDTAVARFPADLARRVQKAADDKEKARRTGAYILLERMARKWAGDFSVSEQDEIVRPEYAGIFRPRNPLEAVHYDAFGKPYFEDKEDTEFNLSHSAHMVACVLSHNKGGVATPCGIDIELLTDNFERAVNVTEGFFSDAEKLALAPYAANPEAFCSLFTRIWTRKEAFLKYKGVGLSEIRKTDTSRVAAEGCYFIETEETLTYKDMATDKECTETYYITVCAKVGEEVYQEAPEEPENTEESAENAESDTYIDENGVETLIAEDGDTENEDAAPSVGMTTEDIRHMHL